VAARRQQDLHRAVEAGVVLEQVLCVQERRVVGQDWCVRWRNRWLQIGVEHAALSLAGRGVLVKQLAGGQLMVAYQDQRLSCRELSARPTPPRVRKAVVNNRRWTPAATHPWNRPARGVQVVPRVSLAPAAPARDLHAEKRKAG
jgi:hypothetical protein